MKSHVLAAAAAFVLASPAAAVVIDFEELTDGGIASPLVYADVTFTSSSGRFFINGAGVGKDLCTYTGSCDAVLTVDFSTAANGLVFQTVGENALGTLFVKIFQQGGGTVDLELGYDGVFSSLDTHDLSAYADIVKLEMSSNDGAGVAYDNFSFTAGEGGVPEPATWAMMLAGFGLVGAAARRRTHRVHA